MSMEHKEFLIKLSEAAVKHAEMPYGECDNVCLEEAEDNVSVSKTIEKEIVFDDNGNWEFSYSIYCPINIDASGYICDCEKGALFNLTIDSNYSQHKEFKNIEGNEKISTTLKTNTFSSTNFKFHISSNKPNSKAKLHLDCEI